MKTTRAYFLIAALALTAAACSAKNPTTIDVGSVINVPIGNTENATDDEAPPTTTTMPLMPTTTPPPVTTSTVAPVVVVPSYPQVTCNLNPPAELVGVGVSVAANSGWGDMHDEYKGQNYTRLADLFGDIDSRNDATNVCVVDVYTTKGTFKYGLTACFSPMPPAMQVNVRDSQFCCVGGFWTHECLD